MKEVVKKQIIKLLDASIIYLIEDSPWVSPIYCVPKKGGMTVVTNERMNLFPQEMSPVGVFVLTTSIRKRPHSRVLMEPTPTSVCLLVFAMQQQPFKEELRDEDIDDNFPDETLMNVSSNDEEILWMIKRYFYGSETQKFLDECHHGPTGGHYGPSTTPEKVFDHSFY
uniref:Reverse transcriptase domain-containing protein n=1 Tax=Tanacetum cinerariifolium TaxID=118510 RepID=A0A699GZE0_TANCI|nr:reverse transcriptase domain-containing protein [Tanacetum cinerariifolium]